MSNINLWELESLIKLKDKLRNILTDRGVVSKDSDNLNALVEKVNQINNDTLVNQMLSEGVENFYNDKITKLAPYALAYSRNVTELIELPNITESSERSLLFSLAKVIKMPKLYRGGDYMFNGSNVEELYINNAVAMGVQWLITTYHLRKLYAPRIGIGVNTIGAEKGTLTHICFKAGVSQKNFSTCEKLQMMVITQKSAITPFSNASYIPKKALTDGDCYIYVPSALLENYKTATNISVYADRIRAIEDYMTEICAEFPDFENDYAKIE